MKSKEKKQDYLLFFSVIGAIAFTAGFIYSILASDKLSEAQKYFAITILLLSYIVAYIRFVVERKIK